MYYIYIYTSIYSSIYVMYAPLLLLLFFISILFCFVCYLTCCLLTCYLLSSTYLSSIVCLPRVPLLSSTCYLSSEVHHHCHYHIYYLRSSIFSSSVFCLLNFTTTAPFHYHCPFSSSVFSLLNFRYLESGLWAAFANWAVVAVMHFLIPGSC